MIKLKLVISILFLLTSLNFAQLIVKDQEVSPNILLQVNDEGTSGSITIPSLSTIGSNTNKLYNLSGTLYWNGSALGTAGSAGGWTHNGTSIYQTTLTDYVGIGTNNPATTLHIKGSSHVQEIESTTAQSYLTIYNSGGYKGYFGTYNGVDDIDIGTGSSNSTGKLYLVTEATPKVTIIPSGNVGIGTVTPGSKLEVNGGNLDAGKFSTDASSGTAVIGYSTGIGGIAIYGNASYSSGDVTNIGGSFKANSSTGIGIFSRADGSSGKGVVSSGGAYDFDATGAGVNYGATSSIRWKRNIVEIDRPLEKLSKLRGVYFDWDEKHGSSHDVGCIAEEVGKVLPEIVIYEKNGIDADGMDYSKLTPLLIEVAKAQQSLIKELKEEIIKIKKKINTYKFSKANMTN